MSARPHALIIPVRLRRAVAGLDQATGRLERAFLQAGDDLMAVTGTSEELVAASVRLVSLAIGQESGRAISEARGVLEDPLRFLAESVPRLRRVIDLLEQEHRGLRRALRLERELRGVMAPMSYVRTLLRIEGARLEGPDAAKLADLGGDIATLQAQLEEVFGSQFQQLHTTESEIGRLLVRMRDEIAAHERIATTAQAGIEEALVRIEGGVRMNALEDTRVGDVSQEVQAEVGRLVLALQFQDIVHQKLQHVREIVGELAAPLEAGREAPGEDLRFAERAGEVVLGLLGSSAQELEDADATVRDGLRVVAAHMRTLDDACVAMYDVEVVSTAVDGFVQVMLETLERVATLLESGTRLAEHASAVVDPVREAVQDVGRRLRGLVTGMHLVGLNAEVQAARIPDAAGLEVLSARTSGIARDTGLLSETVSTDIAKVVASISETADILHDIVSTGHEHADGIRGSSGSVEARLHAFRDESIQGVVRVGELTEQLATRVRTLLARAPFAAHFETELGALRDAVAQAVELARAEADRRGVPADAAAARVAALAGRYTMASERRIHEAAAAGTEAALRRSMRGGGVDLFDDGAAPPDAPPPPAGGDVELF